MVGSFDELRHRKDADKRPTQLLLFIYVMQCLAVFAVLLMLQ